MTSSESDIVALLMQHPELREKLYARGFLATDAAIDFMKHPFYNLWTRYEWRGGTVFCAPGQRATVCEQNGESVCLIGHAYNPFTCEASEQKIVSELAAELVLSERAFLERVNQLTGIFTLLWWRAGCINVADDATGMQTTFYAAQEEHFYISSHTNLLGSLLTLSWDPYVTELAHYKFFKLLGNSLPGNLTQFAKVKRVVPNHVHSFDGKEWTSRRFFTPSYQGLSFEKITDKVAELLHANLSLIANKWKKPAISLTGGCDSKTTLSCANGNYDCFRYFSYISSESERVDADSAHELCGLLNLPHTIYTIEGDNSKYRLFSEIDSLLNWNCGNLRKSHANDVRKRCFFMDKQDFDVEVKSWCSEIGRAYYSKRFNGRTDFGAKPTPRVCTTLYKFFLHNRTLVHKTDEIFADYLAHFFASEDVEPIEWQEQFFWEFRVPSWNGLVITGEHRISFDITIPYNNRLLLELLLNVPIGDRIHDTLYVAIREKMNPVINTHKLVTNLKHTHNRERLENMYYIMNTKILF